MIPKDLTGKELIKLLRQFGYEDLPQNGSHVRIQTNEKGRHSETIPNHKPLKAGTRRQILKNIALHFEISLDELEDRLF